MSIQNAMNTAINSGAIGNYARKDKEAKIAAAQASEAAANESAAGEAAKRKQAEAATAAAKESAAKSALSAKWAQENEKFAIQENEAFGIAYGRGSQEEKAAKITALGYLDGDQDVIGEFLESVELSRAEDERERLKARPADSSSMERAENELKIKLISGRRQVSQRSNHMRKVKQRGKK